MEIKNVTKVVVAAALAAILMLCLFSIPSESSDAASYSAGDQVTVPISISSNPGFNVAEFFVDFDNVALTYKGATKEGSPFNIDDIYYNSELARAGYQESGTIKIGVSEAQTILANVEGDGLLLKLLFVVSSDPIAGDRNFNIYLGERGFIENKDRASVEMTITAEPIHIEGRMPEPVSKLEIDSSFDYTTLGEESKTQISEIVFMDGVTGIPNEAFKGYTALKKITVPASVTIIGNSAFEGCTSLATVDIVGADVVPEPAVYDDANWNVTLTIGEYAFKDCTGLKAIPTNPKIKMEKGALSGSGIESIKLYHASFKTLPDAARYTLSEELLMDCKSLKNVEYVHKTGATAITFAAYMFKGCESLKSFDFGELNTTTKEYCFSESGLEKVELKVKDAKKSYLGTGTFQGCKQLKEFTAEAKAGGGFDISGSQYLFKDCVSLTKVDIDLRGSLMVDAFEGCISLKTLSLGKTVPTDNHSKGIADPVGTSSIPVYFETIDIGTFLVNNTGTYMGDNQADKKILDLLLLSSSEKITFVQTVTEGAFYTAEKGVVYGVDHYRNTGPNRLVMSSRGVSEILIPEQIKTVNANAISKCTSLDRISFPVALTKMNSQEGMQFFDASGALISDYDASKFAGKTFVSDGNDHTKLYQAITVKIYIGGELKEQRVVTSMDPLKDPVVSPGMIFKGWFTDPQFQYKFDPNTTPASEITIYANISMVSDSELINSVMIKQFINGGRSVMLEVDAGDDAPEKALVITYSAYIDLPEGTILNPFITESVQMTKDDTRAIFTPSSASKVESLSVTCCYELGSDLYSTPYVTAMAPAVYADVVLTIDPSLSLTMNDNEVAQGETLRYGFYTVRVEGGDDATYTVNGIVANGQNRLYYHGQPLVVTKAGA